MRVANNNTPKNATNTAQMTYFRLTSTLRTPYAHLTNALQAPYESPFVRRSYERCKGPYEQLNVFLRHTYDHRRNMAILEWSTDT